MAKEFTIKGKNSDFIGNAVTFSIITPDRFYELSNWNSAATLDYMSTWVDECDYFSWVETEEFMHPALLEASKWI